MSSPVVTKVRHLGSLTLIVLIRTPRFVNRIQAMIDHDLCKSIRLLARDVEMSEFLIRQVVHENIWCFSDYFYHRPKKDKRKDNSAKLFNTLKHTHKLNMFWFFLDEKNFNQDHINSRNNRWLALFLQYITNRV